MLPSRHLPLWIATSLLALFALSVRGAPLSAEETGGSNPPAAGKDPAGGGGEEDVIDDSEDGPAEFQEAVNKAIERGVNWLKKKQSGDGSYPGIEGNAVYGGGEKKSQEKQHVSGPTALAMYTLLKCKVPANDPSVRRGFEWLKRRHKLPLGSYETSMLLLAVTATADPFKKTSASEEAAAKDRIRLSGEMRGWAQELVKHLLKKRQALAWRYQMAGYKPAPGGEQDLSSTQMACLALFAAERCGIRIESKVWNDLITFAMNQQEPDGPSVNRAIEAREPKKGEGEADEKAKDRARGHAYILSDKLPPHEGQSTGSMTACGLGTIMMSRFMLMNRKDSLWQKRDQAAVQQSVYDSAAWLEHHWNAIENPRGAGYHLYYLYCVERAFDMIGNRRLGKRFWYLEMGQRLLNIQKPQGFWHTDSTHKPEDVLDTCFALLFLKRATRGGIAYPSITGGSDEPPVDNRGK